MRQRRRHGRHSRADQPLSTGLAERGKRPLAARFRFFQQRAESGIIPQRVELRTACERWGREVTLRDRALKMAESGHVVADVAEQPSFLEDRLWISVDLQRVW